MQKTLKACDCPLLQVIHSDLDKNGCVANATIFEGLVGNVFGLGTFQIIYALSAVLCRP